MLLSAIALDQPMGGVVRHNRELLPRLARLLAAEGGALALMEGRGGVPFALAAEVERLRSPVPARPIALRAAREGAWLKRHLRTAARAGAPFDVVHTAHLPVPRGLGVPLSLTLHDLKPLAHAHAPALRRLAGPAVLAAALREAAVVCVVSEALRAELLARTDADPARVRVVPNGCDHLPLLPRAPGPDAPLLCVGHVEPRKNVALLVRALAADRGLPALAVAGAIRGAEGRRVGQLARALGVADRLRLAGEQDDARLAALYAGAACVVLPSLREGFGIPALEAQRAGAPLAIARTPALVEVAGPSAPRFAPDDPQECARAIRAAMAQGPDELARAAERAATFTWDAAARAWLDALRAARG